ncbi:G kinase-anchoring protein 1-A-like [Lycorma delicatula]|uniref:G kinase-anchoring protein 1-A-like n=1 Tax=Lycorma delicatula TaxID=130591 RepID=UPI003F5133CB
MVLPLASRFAVLSVDDDDEGVKKSSKNQNKKKSDNKPVTNQQSKQQKPDLKKKTKKVENQQNQSSQNQQPRTKSKSSQKKKKAAADQWELWKEKDAQLLDGNYENELHQAILLSQLDYEEKKDVYEQMRKEQELEKKNANIKKKKTNKAQTMSLSEFNSLPESLVKQQESGGGDADISVNGQPESDPEFFERIRQDAKKVFSNEQAAEKRKAREPFVNDAIVIAQFEDQIERRDKEIGELKEEITRLKEELHNVKTRNKTLCQILGQGEMKDKAEVLVQMESTQKVKDELSNEVERLHALLEQERSKVRSLTAEKTKGKNKKRTASENQ